MIKSNTEVVKAATIAINSISQGVRVTASKLQMMEEKEKEYTVNVPYSESVEAAPAAPPEPAEDAAPAPPAPPE
jgi:hypothetical protein